MDQRNLEKKNKVGDITFLGSKLYYKSILNKRVWYWHKKTHKSMEQKTAQK